MEQPKQTKRLPGFYIALCCCVIAIGLAGFFSQKMQSDSQNNTEVSEAVTSEDNSADFYEDAFNADSETVSENEETDELPIVTEPEPEDEEAAMEEYAIDNPDVQAASVTVNAEESGIFADPVPGGAVIAGFSADKLEYNEFYSDWRAHNGIDIAADTGCSVCAIADGTVLETGTASMGGYVIIDHGSGFTATYAQLGDINVKEGDSVTSGSVIGTVAEPIGENAKEPHLHFELAKDGALVDPEEY